MEELRRNIWVGLFVLFGLVALGALIVLFGYGPSALLQRSAYELTIHFDEAGSIRPGNLVTARGVSIGRVSQVDLRDPNQLEEGVVVTVSIDRRYRVPVGSSAQTTEPMLGQGRPPIVLIPGPPGGASLGAGAMIEGRVRRGLESVLPSETANTLESATQRIGEAAEALTPVLNELEELLRKRAPGLVDTGYEQGNISSAVARMDASLKHFNEVLGDPNVKSELREIVDNVHAMSEQGRAVMAKIDKGVDDGQAMITEARGFIEHTQQAVDNIEAQAKDVARAATNGLDKASTFMDDMNTISSGVVRGEGNVGKLFKDDKLYESLVITAERLTQALDEFRALIKEWREGKVRIAL